MHSDETREWKFVCVTTCYVMACCLCCLCHYGKQGFRFSFQVQCAGTNDCWRFGLESVNAQDTFNNYPDTHTDRCSAMAAAVKTRDRKKL